MQLAWEIISGGLMAGFFIGLLTGKIRGWDEGGHGYYVLNPHEPGWRHPHSL